MHTQGPAPSGPATRDADLYRKPFAYMAKKTLRSAEADGTMDRAAEAVPTTSTNGAETPTEAPKKRAPRAKAAEMPAADAAVVPKPRAARKKAEAPEATGDAPDIEVPKKPRASRKKVEPADAAEAPTVDAAPARRRTRATTGDAAAVPAAQPGAARSSRADDSPDASDETPRRRRTRLTREAQPVASSDRLPDDVSGELGRPLDVPEVAPNDRPSDNVAAGAPTPERRRPTRHIDLTSNRPRDERPASDAPRDGFRDERPSGDRSAGERPRDDRGPGGYDEEGGRRKRKRNRNKNKNRDGQPQQGGPAHGNVAQGGPTQGGYAQGGPPQGGGQFQGGHPGGHPGGPPQGGHPGEPFDGVLELIGDKKFGFIRGFSASLVKGDNDPFMPPPLIQRYNLRDGVRLQGLVKPGRKGAMQVVEVTEVMGEEPDVWADRPDFDAGLVIYPDEKLDLVTGQQDLSMRVVDLVSPLGKGQRALIVAPPRAGKTILLKQIAAGLTANHPEVTLVALLIDERPEEVTDFKRNTVATVFASSNDAGEDNHVRVATLAFEYSRRLVEQGKDVVVLLDSLTRLGRTFNLFGGNYSGRTMSGGLDARALVMPRKIFGSARNIEEGGSLTIVATALVETGSRMDEVIFEEFKGTGNSEIVLDRELSEKRIYPAINIRKSGTRNEERLVPEDLVRQRHVLLRALNSRHPVEAMQALAKQIQLSPNNAHLLNDLVPEAA